MMKKIILYFALVFATGLYAQKPAKTTLEVKGNCSLCQKRIVKATLSVKGVKWAAWDIPSDQLTLIYDPSKADLAQVEKAIAASGHDTKNEKAPKEVYEKLPACCLYRDGGKHVD
jgi:mercuric ion binding protein